MSEKKVIRIVGSEYWCEEKEEWTRDITVVEKEVATFKPIPTDLALKLLDFVHQNNIGKTITIDGKEYTLDYISNHHRKLGRSLSIYFTVGKSVIRISDHWSSTRHHPRSRKLNCGQIDSAWWNLADTDSETIKFDRYYSGKYPWVLKAGICGKARLNKTVDHWKNERRGFE